jgi:methylated-DNA-[protein]-cysteine S-methyltransferase
MIEHTTAIDSPIGPLTIAVDDDGALTRINFGAIGDPRSAASAAACSAAIRELREYFDGKRKSFSIATKPGGTPFQLRVWSELAAIPYGVTISYAQLAERIGNPKAVRAVGAANGANPIPVVIPCHRVIGSSGKLVGYGGGLDIKIKLLLLERSTR